MVNRINRNPGRKIDKLTRSDAAAARGFMAQNLSPKNLNSNEITVVDDVISALANAHENRRARQVNEWERMRGTHVQRAA